MSDRIALLIPTSSIGMTNPAFGSLLVHAQHAEKFGKVFWSVFPPGLPRTHVGPFPHKGVKVAYFYDVLSRRVRYKANINDIIGGGDKTRLAKYSKYNPSSRVAYSSKPGQRGEYWILVSNIRELVNPVRLRNIYRAENNRPLRQTRLYALIRDPRLRTINS